MFGVTLAMALALAAQDPTGAQTQPIPETEVEEIIVDGRPLREAVREFVGAVAAPANRRGLAQWRDRVCVGVANLDNELAQYMADRVSDVAVALDVEIGAPGCRPNVLVVFAEDGAATADAMVARDRQVFRMGSSGFELGTAALERFRTDDRPVRWWQISMPVDSETGARAYRLPGDADASGPTAPVISVFAASRLNTQIRDDLSKTIVVIDIDDVANVNFGQLSDYVALIVMAQIDPQGDTSGFTTILNVFDNPGASPGLTEWDWAYLRALYGSREDRHNPSSQAADLARIMTRDRRAAQAAAD